MSGFPKLRENELAVCWVDVRSWRSDAVEAAVKTLPNAEQERFRRYRHALSAHEFVAGRLLARGWLASVTGTRRDEWRFAEGPRGRPEITSRETPYRFNLSHSNGIVACVLAHSREAGVDVEHLARRPVDADLWHRYCAAAEITDIECQSEDQRQRRFLTYWTLKEAYLKARGLGIAVTLAEVAFNLSEAHPTVEFLGELIGTPRDWAFGLAYADDDHLVSWATPQRAGALRPTVPLVHLQLSALAR